MKIKYETPVVTLERFVVNDAVAACEPTSQTTYPEQTINCVIAGSDRVFYSGCTSNASQSGRLVTYNGTLYYLWYDSSIPRPNSFDDRLIKAIQSAAGIGEQPGWHAGVATQTIISIVNQS